MKVSPDTAQTARINAAIDKLASFTEADRPFTRLVFSPEFDAARHWLADAFAAAGLFCHIDSGGNLIGTRTANLELANLRQAGGGKAGRAKVLIGSHIDTVPAGGRFDGIAGVIAALEVVHYLNEHQIELPFDLEIVDYLGEELNVWGTSCLGSRHMAGLLTPEILGRVDAHGRQLASEITRIGGSTLDCDEVRSDADQILACLELHIEQAKLLETQGHDIGIVTAIPGIYRYGISVKGQAGHSGTTQMDDRQDALVAAADIIQAVNDLATDIARHENQHFVATIGKIEVFPNGAAIVPGEVEMTLDMRSASANAKSAFLKAFETICRESAAHRHCAVDVTPLAAADIAPMDSGLMQNLSDAAAVNGLSAVKLASGAGHDTAHLSRIAPAAIIFIPCRDGLSHCPEEFASNEAIARGASVLTSCVLALAGKPSKVVVQI
ncbi:Zn-dependent hydrolase [Alphaproteobacteria bacterium]|nr:Zn-dependent hydrolase [Alphaproteobacteria bacterium]